MNSWNPLHYSLQNITYNNNMLCKTTNQTPWFKPITNKGSLVKLPIRINSFNLRHRIWLGMSTKCSKQFCFGSGNRYLVITAQITFEEFDSKAINLAQREAPIRLFILADLRSSICLANVVNVKRFDRISNLINFCRHFRFRRVDPALRMLTTDWTRATSGDSLKLKSSPL